jgi:hypothetical protein
MGGAKCKIYFDKNGAWSMEVLGEVVDWELIAYIYNDLILISDETKST